MLKSELDPIVREIISALGEENQEIARRVQEISLSVIDGRFQKPDGALVDSFQDETPNPDIAAQLQTYSATCTSEQKIDSRRRDFLKKLAAGTAAGGAAAFSGWGLYALDYFRQPMRYKFDDEFIRTLIRFGSDRPALYKLRHTLLTSGKIRESELIYLVTRHGDNFGEIEPAIATLNEILRSNNLSELADTYIRWNYATHFRYIGLSQTSFDKGLPLRGRRFFQYPELQARIINQSHMNFFHTLYGKPNFAQNLRDDNEKLASAYRDFIGNPIKDVAPGHLRFVLNKGLEVAALCGIAHTNAVIASRSEQEAREAFAELFIFCRNLADICGTQESDYLVMQTYAESLWPIARVAPFALLNRWGNRADHLVDLFFEGWPNASPRLRDIHARLMTHERERLGSPLWIQMAILKSAREQEKHSAGDKWLQELIPSDRKHLVYGHVVLTRALNALEVKLGKDPWEVPHRLALARSESVVLLDVIGRLRDA